MSRPWNARSDIEMGAELLKAVVASFFFSVST